MKVYISGPMTGLPEFNYPAFFMAAEIIRSHGHEPINPAEGMTDMDKPWVWYMRRALRMLLDADEVWMLPRWQRSKGARLERIVALALGMRIQYLSPRVLDIAELAEEIAPGPPPNVSAATG